MMDQDRNEYGWCAPKEELDETAPAPTPVKKTKNKKPKRKRVIVSGVGQRKVPSPRYEKDDGTKPVNLKTRLRMLIIENPHLSAHDLADEIKPAALSPIAISNIRQETKDTIKVLRDMGLLE